jgi:hypothetical protein
VDVEGGEAAEEVEAVGEEDSVVETKVLLQKLLVRIVFSNDRCCLWSF